MEYSYLITYFLKYFSHLNTYVYCKVNGGREGRQIGAYELAKAVEELGAGEILLNCIDCDGKYNFASFNYISLYFFFIKCTLIFLLQCSLFFL